MECTQELCLICSSSFDIGHSDHDNFKSPFQSKVNFTLSTQLDVIFVLRNLLQVPVSQLEEYLESYGSPCNWMHLCSQCSTLIEKAIELHQQVVKINKELKTIQGQVINSIRESVQADGISGDVKKITEGSTYSYQRGVFFKVRTFVVNNEYKTLTDPFSSGDASARRLASELMITSPSLESPDSPVLDEASNDTWYSDADDDYEPVEESKPVITLKPRKKRIRKPVPNQGLRKRNRRTYQCPHCPETFTELSKFNSHLSTAHQIEYLVCPEKNCGKVFSGDKRYPKFQQHLLVHPVNGETFPCEKCDQVFSYRKNLHSHLRRHHLPTSSEDQKSRTCELCDKQFTTKDGVADHKRRIHKVDRSNNPIVVDVHTCDLCGLDFSTRHNLVNHIKYVHQKEGKSHRCHLCGKGFISPFNFKAHFLAMHKDAAEEEGLKEFRCEVKGCRKLMLTEKSWNLHKKRYHEGNEVKKEFKCGFCKREFSERHRLVRHEMMHKSKQIVV